MRIISGKFRGRKILLPSDELTRPLKDSTKESIFNIIRHSNLLNIDLEKSNILDLFSGIGSFGFECLSRGALFVTFLESYKDALIVLKKNLDNLGLHNYSKIIEKDIFSDDTLKYLDQKFEIIFLDPPYKEKRLFNLLDKIIRLKLLKKNGIIIIHRHKNEEDVFPSNFNILLKKKYGISKIIFGRIT